MKVMALAAAFCLPTANKYVSSLRGSSWTTDQVVRLQHMCFFLIGSASTDAAACPTHEMSGIDDCICVAVMQLAFAQTTLRGALEPESSIVALV